jgi:hypothetical protein
VANATKSRSARPVTLVARRVPIISIQGVPETREDVGNVSRTSVMKIPQNRSRSLGPRSVCARRVGSANKVADSKRRPRLSYSQCLTHTAVPRIVTVSNTFPPRLCKRRNAPMIFCQRTEASFLEMCIHTPYAPVAQPPPRLLNITRTFIVRSDICQVTPT